MTAQRIPVTVKVTPRHIDGDVAVCEIDGDPRYINGGLIRLRRGGPPYVLAFELQDGDYPGLKFDESSPGAAFWCDTAGCPTSAMNNSNSQLQNPEVGCDGRTLRVAAEPKGAKNAVHYSLNFENGARYDPIIIND